MVALSPRRTVVPGFGVCPTTVAPLDEGITTTCTSRPRPESSRSAAVRGSPATFGMGNVLGPRETTSVTPEPCGAVPFDGCCRVTRPRETVPENRSTRCTTNPAAWRMAVASSTGRPMTCGTRTGCGPLLTKSFTALPYRARAGPSGDWVMTRPTGTVCDQCRTTCGTNPRCPSSLRAVVAGSPFTDGTRRNGGPDERRIVTAEPFRRRGPGPGDSRPT